MKILDFTLKSIIGNKIKSFILFFLFFIIGCFVSITLSLNQAMSLTETQLMSRLPTATTLVFKSGYEFIQPTFQEIREIGELPYVKTYDFTFRIDFFSEDIVWPSIDNPNSLGILGRAFTGRGVNNPNISDIQSGTIYLVDGRVFTEEEIVLNAPVVILPRDIALNSGLWVESVFTIKNIVLNTFAENENDLILDYEEIEITVVGIIGHTSWHDTDLIYMPIGLTERMLNFQTETKLEFDDFRFREHGQGSLQEEPLIETLFVIDNPKNLDIFKYEASQILQTPWEILGFDERIFTDILISMDNIRGLATNIENFVLLTGSLLLILIIIIFFKNRMFEIGIYISLGQKKSHLISHVTIELLLIATVSLLFAFLIGYFVSQYISLQLLEEHLLYQISLDSQNFHPHWQLSLYTPLQMSIEETLALFDIGIDFKIVINYILFSFYFVTLSILIMMFSIYKIEPKKLLLRGNIG